MALHYTSMAQAPDTQWTRVYLEENNEYAHSIKELKSGYIIAGSNWNESFADYDIYIMNIDLNGNIMWTELYGDMDDDAAYSIYVTEDEGYILTGESDSYGFFLLRTDYAGNLMWIRSYPGTVGRSVIETEDGGYIAVGKSYNSLFVVRTNPVGDSLWCKTYGQSFYSGDAYSICMTSDGCYAIVGYVKNQMFGNSDLFLLKLNQYGDTLWTRVYGGDGSEGGDCIEETADGGLIIAGRTTSVGAGFWDVYLLKTDCNGYLEWSRTFGGSEWDGAHSVQQTESGGYFVGAYSLSFGSVVDYYFIETNSSGDELWYKIVGEYSESDWSHSSIITSDGGYIMAGGKWLPNDNLRDIYVVKLASNSTHVISDTEKTDPLSKCFSQNYPNPFNNTTTIIFNLPYESHSNLTIYDILGRRVEILVDGILPEGQHRILWDASRNMSGTYFYILNARDTYEKRKIVLLK